MNFVQFCKAESRAIERQQKKEDLMNYKKEVEVHKKRFEGKEMQIQRYSHELEKMYREPDGEYVLHSDYATLMAQKEALEKELAEHEWVRVKDGLPDPGDIVLGVFIQGGRVWGHQAVYITESLVRGGTGTWRDSVTGRQAPWFTHWSAPMKALLEAPHEAK